MILVTQSYMNMEHGWELDRSRKEKQPKDCGNDDDDDDDDDEPEESWQKKVIFDDCERTQSCDERGFAEMPGNVDRTCMVVYMMIWLGRTLESNVKIQHR